MSGRFQRIDGGQAGSIIKSQGIFIPLLAGIIAGTMTPGLNNRRAGKKA